MRSALGPLLLGACPLATAGRDAGAADVVVGLGGVHRTAAWTPIVVAPSADERAPAGDWRVWVEDPDGQWVRSPPPVETVGDGGRRLRFSARFGRPAGAVQLEGPPGTGASRRTTVTAAPAAAGDEFSFLVIGELGSVARAARLMRREGEARPRVIEVAAPGDLAAGARGITARDLDGIDVIVACGNALADAGDALAAEVLAAVDGWVRDGGALVLLAGESAARLATPDAIVAGWIPGPLGRPGRVERLVPLRRSAAIETFARAARPLDKAALAGLQVPLLADAKRIDGTILAFEGRSAVDLPLAVRRVHGLGMITWLGLDIDRPAFRSWPGTDTLLVELLGGRTAAAGRAGEMVRGGLDLDGQLRNAIDRFPGVSSVPFELIAGLGLLYVACLYPLDWWLAARGGRAATAWLSLPVLVAAFSGVAWETGRRWKGVDWRATAAGLVDVDVVGGSIRGRSWSGTWAPVNSALDVAAAPAETAAAAGGADVAVSWYDATGRRLGATEAASPHPALGAADYATADGLTALAGVPIAADASRLFEASWSARGAGPPAAMPIVSALASDVQAALRGTIESHLPFALESCVLVHAGWLYDVGRLAPGGRFEPGAGRGPRSLAGALTRRAADKERDVAERWDATSADIDRILEIAGFFRAAGGGSYTALDAGRLARLDLSPVLDTGRAVLVGRGPAGTAWRVDARRDGPAAAADPVTIWRFVLPLEASGS